MALLDAPRSLWSRTVSAILSLRIMSSLRIVLPLALRLLRRQWLGSDIRILGFGLMLAVAVVSGIHSFTERLERSLTAQSSQFLAADRIVRSGQPIPSSWQDAADAMNVATALTTQFTSMVAATSGADDAPMHLAAVKAVSEGYPLRGGLSISDQAFSADPDTITVANSVPVPGEAWVDSRLLPLLGIKLGEQLDLGYLSLTVTKVIISEPDRGDNFSLYGARVLINHQDLTATQILQPGSRVRYNLLLAGETAAIDKLLVQLESSEPPLGIHQRVITVDSAQRGLAENIDRGRRYLLLAAVIGVLLAGVAMVIAAQRFAARHVDQVALLKSLGAGRWRIRGLYLCLLLLLALVATALGLLLGFILQQAIAFSLQSFYPVSLPAGDWRDYSIGVYTGVVSLLCFTLPPIWQLSAVPPIRILRGDVGFAGVSQALSLVWGLLALLLLVAAFSADLTLTLGFTLGLCALVLVAALLAVALLWCARYVGGKAGHIWRLALANLQRNRSHTLVQMLVFAVALMLLFSLFAIRDQLLAQWQQQLPEETPNHFLINIAEEDQPALQNLLQTATQTAPVFYPLIRARLELINNQEPDAEMQEHVEVLRREANVSWQSLLADDNRIIKGQWWDEWQPQAGQASVGVSVEQEVAEGLGLVLGDQLQFSVGGLPLLATVASIRSLRWDSMRPNFYFLLSPNVQSSNLQDPNVLNNVAGQAVEQNKPIQGGVAQAEITPSYLTSVHLSAAQKPLINTLLQQFPTVVVIEMDKVIEQIRTVIDQVSRGVELVLWLVLACGLLVLLAAVQAGFDERQQQVGLLRALGCSRRLLLGSLWLEFSLLGGLAGLLAVIGTQALLIGLQSWLMNMSLQLSWALWLAGPLVGALLVGSIGVACARRTLHTPPMVVLRES